MKYNTIDEYINEFPDDIREKLNTIRNTIRNAVPEATEKISWRMPSFYLNGSLIQFAAFKAHIGLFPGPDAIVNFRGKLKDYKTSKGTIQLPYDKPIPINLIKEIVEFNVKNRN